MPDTVSYAVRRSALEQERVWSVGAGGFSWSAPDKAGHFDFNEIATIRLRWTGSRFDHARYACDVIRFNGWTETVVSTHYDGPARFSDRAASYRSFIDALVRRTAEANPACRFLAGSSVAGYALNLVAAAAGLLLLVVVLLAIGLPITLLIAVKLALLAFLVPLALRWLKQNRPRSFLPHAIPADVLPALGNP